MSPTNLQEILDKALDREQEERPDAEIDLLGHAITALPGGGHAVYLLYAYTTPAWESKGGVKFDARQRIRYSVRLPHGGGASGQADP